MNQLKYLVLIPVLVSMLFYTSCAETDVKEEVIATLELQTRYRMDDGKLVGEKGSKITYLDSYIGISAPIGAKEIPFENLSKDEKNEFNEMNEEFAIRLKEKPTLEQMFRFKFYEMPNKRKSSAMIFDMDKLKKREENKIIEERKKNGEIIETQEVSFMVIDKVPTFPGCKEGDKACFSKMVQKHFAKEFDADLPNELNLSAGKKKIFIGFKIDTEGNVVDIQARAPHEDIKDEVIRVMNSLPIMIPGENNGEKVTVKYSIPFTIIVE